MTHYEIIEVETGGLWDVKRDGVVVRRMMWDVAAAVAWIEKDARRKVYSC